MGLALSAPVAAAERRSWSLIRYIGGTVEIETTRYDYNTTLTFSPSGDTITIQIAPAKIFRKAQTVVLKPAQIVSISLGTAAWRHAADVSGAKLPPHSPSLFGLLQDSTCFAIVYELDGKRGALLFTSNWAGQIVTALGKVTGKDIEVAH